jgi:hypothetical protein
MYACTALMAPVWERNSAYCGTGMLLHDDMFWTVAGRIHIGSMYQNVCVTGMPAWQGF